MKKEIVCFIVKYVIALLVCTLLWGVVASVFAGEVTTHIIHDDTFYMTIPEYASDVDWTDTEEFSYQMEYSMRGLECAMKGYHDDVRCTIYWRNK